MQNYVYKLDAETRRRLIHDRRGFVREMAEKYHVTRETVRNRIAQNFLAGGGDGELAAMLGGAARLAEARRPAAAPAPRLCITNHFVLSRLLSGKQDAEESGIHYERAELECGPGLDGRICWEDVLILSALHSAVDRAGNGFGADARLSIDDLHGVLFPSCRATPAIRKRLLEEASATIGRFRDVRGRYHIHRQEYPIDGDFFIDGEFGPDGWGVFRKSTMQVQAETMKRRVLLPSELLPCRNDLSALSIRTWLAYRHAIAGRPRSRMRKAISIRRTEYRLRSEMDRRRITEAARSLADLGLFSGLKIDGDMIRWKGGESADRDLAVVRDAADHLIRPEMTGEAEERNRALNALNMSNAGHSLTLDGRRIPAALKAKYRGDYSHGGRLYASGAGNYQSLGKAERQRCLIDGEPVAELDYSCLHPRILYDGLNVKLEGDAYDFWPDRSLAKKAFNIVLNASGRESALAALAREAGPEDAEKILKAAEERHAPVSEMFYSAEWGTLQNTDAGIILHACSAMAEAGLPAYPIHDSIMCRVSDLGAAMDAMAESYRREFSGCEPDITVSVGGRKLRTA